MVMFYKGERVYTMKEFKKIIGVSSYNGVHSFCKRHGIEPMKLTRAESVMFGDENRTSRKYPRGILLFTTGDMDKALSVQGFGRELVQANPVGNVMSFSCSEFQQLRVIEDANGNPWFVGKDVAEDLGYLKERNAIREHVYDEDKALLKQKNGMGIVVVNENSSKSPVLGRLGNNGNSKGRKTRRLEINGINENGSKVRESRTLGNPFPSPINITGLNVPPRGLTIINESGMYSLIFGSKLESARRFKHWVTSEVLPSIRKTGSYSMKESDDSTSNTVDEKLDEIVKQIRSIKAYLITRDTAQVLVSRQMMKE
ncbi:BRO family, N-terminal domain protein [Mitsuokella multacida DSM 20544]|uniref:BRO family, N-terminal domain protein n=2 Tax=Mitsuokella multacida TaxID=52226 RepID=C9KJB9_9FIRM|nr:BRO family, N-terminal domain protein [Mitsuokella multacida DSM 20544]